MTDSPDNVKRKCRWCGRKFVVPRDYPKRVGCPECQPQLVPEHKPLVPERKQ